MVAFCDWVLSFGFMILSFIHVSACVSAPFFFMAEYYSTVWVDRPYHVFLGFAKEMTFLPQRGVAVSGP